jgi:hypothetical protein
LTFSHACFISYHHSDDRNTQRFLEQFRAALESYFDQRLSLKTYLDTDRLKPGFKYNVALAKALRESTCLIAILSPLYFKSDYCRLEYVFMRELETKRRQHTGAPPETHSLVIPLLVWGTEKQVPQEIRDHTQLTKLPFKLLNLSQRIDEDANLLPVLERIGELICELYDQFDADDLCGDAVSCCVNVAFPDIKTIGPWQTTVPPKQGFPGRSPAGGKP